MADRQALSFSIAAINDTSSPRPCTAETLPPSKEAQEARLAQTYQEALLELQAGDFPEAQGRLQSILQDNIILLAGASKSNDGLESLDKNPMLQLRYSTLKNLAGALYKQGSAHHDDALDCYLQAASIDQGDFVLWNNLGSLACALGHLNIARFAFERGLLCSPKNWLCLEKLAEVLIAIGDEEACHDVVKRLLKISPSHPRAAHIDDVLHGQADARQLLKKRENFSACLYKLNVLPRGLDLLEPQHLSLSFAKKRHAGEEDEDKRSSKRKRVEIVEARIPDLSWCDVLMLVLDHLQVSVGMKAAETRVSPVQDNVLSREAICKSADSPLVNRLVALVLNRKPASMKGRVADGGPAVSSLQEAANLEKREPSSLELSEALQPDEVGKNSSRVAPAITDAVAWSSPGAEVRRVKEPRLENDNNSVNEDVIKQQCVVETADSLKEAEAVYEDGFPSHERRSFRLEKIRTRRFDKDEVLVDKHKDEDQSECLEQLLEPFISGSVINAKKYPSYGQPDRNGGHGTAVKLIETDAVLIPEDLDPHERLVSEEEVDVQQFITGLKLNSGPYHVAHELLERLCVINCQFRVPVSKLLMLESMTRQFSWTERSRQCSMFLAELCLDAFMSSSCKDSTSRYLTECEFHLCRVVESAALFAAFTGIEGDNAGKESDIVSKSMAGSTGQERNPTTNTKRKIDGLMRDAAERTHSVAEESPKQDQDVSEVQPRVGILSRSKESDWSLWVRYHWLNCQWHLCFGRLEEAYQELTLCSAILDSRGKLVDQPASVWLPHCKWENIITHAKVRCKLHELHIDKLLKYPALKMVEEAQYSELINILAPALLHDSELNKSEFGYDETRKGFIDTLPEYTGLNMLISACEKVSPPNLAIALQCHARKLEILCGSARSSNSGGKSGPLDSRGLERTPSNSEEEQRCRGNEVEESKLVAEEVNCISNCAARIRDNVGKSGCMVFGSVQQSLLGEIQRLLLDLLCHYISIHDAEGSTSAHHSFNLQFNSSWLIEAFIAFCRLQHLDASATLKEQVSLLATVHDVLAVRGLCCAGNGQEDGEGAFLKLAIKHLRTVELSSRPPTCQSKVLESGAAGVMEIDERSEENLLEDINDTEDEGFESEGGSRKRKQSLESLEDDVEEETEQRRLDLGLDSVLDQCFYCLYGLNLRGGFETSSQSGGLAEHRNTNHGDYKTKEQCAGVFHYILPYAKTYSRSRLLKLRKILRAVHAQFPSPPPDILSGKAVDPFLDDPDFDEESFSEMVLSGKSVPEIMDFGLKVRITSFNCQEMQGVTQADTSIDPHSKKQEMRKCNLSCNGEAVRSGTNSQNSVDNTVSEISGWKCSSDSQSNMDVESEELYFEVYKNLYHFLSEVEDTSASEKWAGFVLTKEGEEFVDQNAKLLKYDLCCNPLRVESWYKLAKTYDEEVDLMLNDGSKNLNVVDWRKNSNMSRRVEMSRRRTRRCLLVTLALSNTSEKQSEMHELLALVYYESLQNVAPSYDQRHHVPERNAAWMSLCEMALKHFERAFMHKPDWTHLYYMGKLYEKLCRPLEESFDLYKRAVDMKSSAVDPVYRLHASRLKLLCRSDKHDVKVLQVVARHCYLSSVREKVCPLFKSQLDSSSDVQESLILTDLGSNNELLVKVRSQLFEDCFAAMRACMEGELKHYHKARFRLAHGLYNSIENQDIDRSKEELAFCFRTSRSLFTINMWEIDGSLRRIKRKAAHQTNLDVQMLESSRKFITCVRKYLLLYLSMCEKTGDIYTLERAFYSLRTDKKFSLCLDDIARLSLGKYIQALATAICQADANETFSRSMEYRLLEKLFNLFMEYGTSWSESLQISLAEAEVATMTESSIYGYIHRYLNLLENEVKLDSMEAINERIRKRFKTFKLLCSQTSEICRHACLAWGRALCYSLASITPILQSWQSSQRAVGVTISADQTTQLMVDLQDDIFMTSSYKLPGGCRDDPISDSSAEWIMKTNVASDSTSLISRMKGVIVSQATPQDLEQASALLQSAYVFYRDSFTGPFPGGINLFLLDTVALENESTNYKGGRTGRDSEALDISTPRKLLLWAFALVHGRTGSVAEAVKYCEEYARAKKSSS